MDEPTSALTSREVDQLFVLIERLVARGVAVVYITHRLDEVYRIGQRVTVLRDGANVATSLLSDVTVAELVRLMANRDLSEHFPRRRGRRARICSTVEASAAPACSGTSASRCGPAKSSASRDCLVPDEASSHACSPAPIVRTPAASSATATRWSFAVRPTQSARGSACCRKIARRRAWSPA